MIGMEYCKSLEICYLVPVSARNIVRKIGVKKFEETIFGPDYKSEMIYKRYLRSK